MCCGPGRGDAHRLSNFFTLAALTAGYMQEHMFIFIRLLTLARSMLNQHANSAIAEISTVFFRRRYVFRSCHPPHWSCHSCWSRHPGGLTDLARIIHVSPGQRQRGRGRQPELAAVFVSVRVCLPRVFPGLRLESSSPVVRISSFWFSAAALVLCRRRERHPCMSTARVYQELPRLVKPTCAVVPSRGGFPCRPLPPRSDCQGSATALRLWAVSS